MLHSIPKILSELETAHGEDYPLPHYLQVGAVMYGLQKNFDIPYNKLDKAAFESLRQAQVRREGKDEDELTELERQTLKPIKSLEDYRARFEEGVCFAMQFLTDDGHMLIIEPGKGAVSATDPIQIASRLNLHNSFIAPAHVREAQFRLTPRGKRLRSKAA